MGVNSRLVDWQPRTLLNRPRMTPVARGNLQCWLLDGKNKDRWLHRVSADDIITPCTYSVLKLNYSAWHRTKLNNIVMKH